MRYAKRADVVRIDILAAAQIVRRRERIDNRRPPGKSLPWLQTFLNPRGRKLSTTSVA